MIQNPISCLMFLQLVHWLRDGKTTLADRRPPVCQIMPDPQIPRSICDAVVQVDNDMNILDSDKLSLLLYQNSTLDLVGTSFKDLLSPLDWQQFQDDIRAVQDGGFMPILARLKGSYDTKIRVAIYVSVLPQADGEVGVEETLEESCVTGNFTWVTVGICGEPWGREPWETPREALALVWTGKDHIIHIRISYNPVRHNASLLNRISRPILGKAMYFTISLFLLARFPEVRYFLGITEDEEKLEASPCPTPRIKSPVPSNLSQVLQRLDPAVEEPDLEAALEEAEREDSVAAELELQEFVEEEQMQAMMSFLWTWPLASQDVQDACCDTHHILSRAAEP